MLITLKTFTDFYILDARIFSYSFSNIVQVFEIPSLSRFYTVHEGKNGLNSLIFRICCIFFSFAKFFAFFSRVPIQVFANRETERVTDFGFSRDDMVILRGEVGDTDDLLWCG